MFFPNLDLLFLNPQKRVYMYNKLQTGYNPACFLVCILLGFATQVSYFPSPHDKLRCSLIKQILGSKL